MSADGEPLFGGKCVLAGVRTELGVSQKQFAELLGCSARTVQSAEQGWRRPGAALEKLALLLLVSLRRGADLSDVCCWQTNACSAQQREQCLTYRHRQGHLCWFFTATMCGGRPTNTWDEKRQRCLQCDLLRSLVEPRG